MKNTDFGPFDMDSDEWSGAMTLSEFANPGRKPELHTDLTGAQIGNWGDGGPARVIGTEKAYMFAGRAAHVLGPQFHAGDFGSKN